MVLENSLYPGQFILLSLSEIHSASLGGELNTIYQLAFASVDLSRSLVQPVWFLLA